MTERSRDHFVCDFCGARRAIADLIGVRRWKGTLELENALLSKRHLCVLCGRALYRAITKARLIDAIPTDTTEVER